MTLEALLTTYWPVALTLVGLLIAAVEVRLLVKQHGARIRALEESLRKNESNVTRALEGIRLDVREIKTKLELTMPRRQDV